MHVVKVLVGKVLGPLVTVIKSAVFSLAFRIALHATSTYCTVSTAHESIMQAAQCPPWACQPGLACHVVQSLMLL